MKLLEACKVGGLSLRNRLVFPPIGTDFVSSEGVVTDEHIYYYSRRAKGEVGLIIIEATAVDKAGGLSNTLSLYDDKFIPGFRRLVSEVRRFGSRVGIQLFHAGRQTSLEFTGSTPVAPSAIPDPIVKVMPRELKKSEIEELIRKFCVAAERAKEAGCDCIEFHGAHGHLIGQFLSPSANKREDEYGGDTVGRAKFATEIVGSARKSLGNDLPILFRISVTEQIPYGYNEEEAVKIINLLDEAGVDIFDLSAGILKSLEWTVAPWLFKSGYLYRHILKIRRHTKKPVIAVGKLGNYSTARKWIEEGVADLVAIGRGLIADPDLPVKWKRQTEEQKERFSHTTCIACNGCLDRFFQFKPIRCTINPSVGKEGITVGKVRYPKVVFAIGASPGGLEAARIAALKGHRVTVFEEDDKVGIHWGWMHRKVVRNKIQQIKEAGGKFLVGELIKSRILDKDSLPDSIVATLGIRQITPRIPGLANARLIPASDILDQEIGLVGKFLILGRGNVGLELIYSLLKSTSDIIYVELGNKFGHGIESLTKRLLLERMLRKGVKFYLDGQPVKIEKSCLHYSIDKRIIELTFDHLINGNGYISDESILSKLNSLIQHNNVDCKTYFMEPCWRPREILSHVERGFTIGMEL